MNLLITIPLYQVDAFSNLPFAGNPAAVCPLENWLDDELMQQIAMENNLAETAFFVDEGEHYRIRWFTPTCEVDLCGHATLASAFVLWHYLGDPSGELHFQSRSGLLSVQRGSAQQTGEAFRDPDLLILDFPARPIAACATNPQLLSALGLAPEQVRWQGHSDQRALLELDSPTSVQQLAPDMAALRQCAPDVVYVTSFGEDVDFVCRVFAPKKGIDEDPVTGSAYTALTPHWAGKKDRVSFTSRQISPRGGEIVTALREGRVLIAGNAICVLQGNIVLPVRTQ